MTGIKAIRDLEERVTALTARITAIEPEVAAQIREEEALEREHARQLGLEQLGEGSRAAVEGSREQWKRSKQRRFALAAALADLKQRHTQAEQDLRQAKADALRQWLRELLAEAQTIVGDLVASTKKGQGLVVRLKGIGDSIYTTGREFEQLVGHTPGRLPDLLGPINDQSLADPTGADLRFSPAAAAVRYLMDLMMRWAMLRRISGGPGSWEVIGQESAAREAATQGRG